MKELTVISGKGGTGKTTIVASFAVLSRHSVLADCDVDAADLHLVLKPSIRKRENFSGGSVARIKSGYCVACGKCEEVCMFDAVFYDGPGNGSYPKTFRVDPIFCEGCGVCAWFCAENAIDFSPAINGQWFISDTAHGPMVHAKLGIAEENSGKLVTLVRNRAKKIAEEQGLDTIIVDGSPGIGWPVIASITGADLVLIVTEPTMSGVHDLERVAGLAGHFGIKTVACVNKADINPGMADRIEEFCADNGLSTTERIDYDPAVTKAQVQGKSVIEYSESKVAGQMRRLWNSIAGMLN